MALQNVVSPTFAIDSGWVNPPSNAFDGNPESNWATSQVSSEGISGVCWIGQNFGANNAKNISQMNITQLSPQTAISDVTVQYSDNGSSWTSAGAHAISKDTALNTLNFMSVGSHQYWRLLAGANPGGTERWQVTEITMSQESVASSGQFIASDFPLGEANGGVTPVINAFLGGSVADLEWMTAEIGSGVNGISWFGQKFRSPQEVRRITFEHKNAATSVSSVHVLYGSDPAALSVSGPYSVDLNAAIDLPALGSHIYWRVRANSAPIDRWHVRRCYMKAMVNEWDATKTWVQAYIETNIPWTANSSVTNSQPQALQVLPVNARWADAFDEYDPTTYRYTAKRVGKLNFRGRVQLSGSGIAGVHLHLVKNADIYGGFYRPVYHGAGNHGFDINMPVAVMDYVDLRMQIEQGTSIVIDGHRSLFEITA